MNGVIPITRPRYGFFLAQHPYSSTTFYVVGRNEVGGDAVMFQSGCERVAAEFVSIGNDFLTHWSRNGYSPDLRDIAICLR